MMIVSDWHVMSTASNSYLKQSCSDLTNVTSALEVIFNVVHSINPCFTYLLTYLLSVTAAAVVKHFSEKSRVLVEGESLELECRTWGYPPPQVTWTRLSRSDSDAVEIVSGGRVTLSDIDSVVNARLTITDMSINDYGTYTCVARNGVGNASDSEAILIRVKGIAALPVTFSF